MAFSGGVKLGDLDDFINLAQDCVKPLIEAAAGGGAAKLDGSGMDSALQRGNMALAAEPVVPLVQRPNLIKAREKRVEAGEDGAPAKKAQIGQVTLSDCLACSGCVTSAETVLLQQQSGEEFRRCAAEYPVTVVSISAETRTSLAQHCGLDPLLTLRKLAAVLSHFGADYILDSSASEAIALLEAKAEFIRRFKEAQQTASRAPANGRASGNAPDASRPPLPMITSHCPGWTLYAEKVADPAVLPHLATLRPPQQVQGRLVKTVLLESHNRLRLLRAWRSRTPLFAAQSWRWTRTLLQTGDSAAESMRPLEPKDIYHVAVQPCFDRKIEASRPHFEAEAGVREVDTVLTTTELLELVQAFAVETGLVDEEASGPEAMAAVQPLPLDALALTDIFLGRFDRAPPLIAPVAQEAGSGGFLEFVFREAAAELFSTASVGSRLELRTKQNEDMREVVLEDPDSKRVLLKFSAAYGFRNIQNIIRRLTKEGTDPAKQCGHFVEVLACPGGCLNGGGQIPPKSDSGPKLERKDRIEQMEALYHSGEGTALVAPCLHPLVLPLYRHIAARARSSAASGIQPVAAEEPLEQLIGAETIRNWLAAGWKSLKVNEVGQDIVAMSNLKW